MEHVHSIIIVKKDNKYLNIYDKRWDMLLFPNIKGVYHKEKRKYHHYFYEVNADIEGNYYSLDELLSYEKVKMNNSDIIGYIENYYLNR